MFFSILSPPSALPTTRRSSGCCPTWPSAPFGLLLSEPPNCKPFSSPGRSPLPSSGTRLSRCGRTRQHRVSSSVGPGESLVDLRSRLHPARSRVPATGFCWCCWHRRGSRVDPLPVSTIYLAEMTGTDLGWPAAVPAPDMAELPGNGGLVATELFLTTGAWVLLRQLGCVPGCLPAGQQVEELLAQGEWAKALFARQSDLDDWAADWLLSRRREYGISDERGGLKRSVGGVVGVAQRKKESGSFGGNPGARARRNSTKYRA